MNPIEFITCEILYNGESLGLATWCPYCKKGFPNDDNKRKCPYCKKEIKSETTPK